MQARAIKRVFVARARGAVFGKIDVLPVRPHRRALRTAFAFQHRRVASIGQQREFKTAQRGGRVVLRGKLCQGFAIGGKETGVRVFAGGELQNQFIEVVAAQQRLAAKPGQTALPEGLREGFEFACAVPA